MRYIKRGLLSLALIIITLLSTQEAQAQRLALKTNTIDWLTTLVQTSLSKPRLSTRLSLQVGVSSQTRPTYLLQTPS